MSYGYALQSHHDTFGDYSLACLSLSLVGPYLPLLRFLSRTLLQLSDDVESQGIRSRNQTFPTCPTLTHTCTSLVEYNYW